MSAVKTEKAARTTKAKATGSTSKAAPKKAVKTEKSAAVESTEKVVKTTAKSVAKVSAADAVVAPKKAAAPKRALLGQGTGRRKASVARVFLRLGKGEIIVNDLPYEKYFDTDIARLAVKGLVNAIPDVARYDVLAKVQGGGSHGQADAVKLGISRALLQANPELKPALRANGFLTVDARVKERKKFGRKAARRGFQFVKR